MGRDPPEITLDPIPEARQSPSPAMIRKPQVTVRRLMKWVVGAAILLALFRDPFNAVRELQRFDARAREGYALVQSYRVQWPPGVTPVSWDQAVGVVQTAWVNVVSPGSIDDADLDDILGRMRTMVSRATPAEAEGDLYRILDLLAHAKTKAPASYLSKMRNWLKSAIPGQGRPSPGLTFYAHSLAGSKAGETPVATLTAGLQARDWQVRVACCRTLGQYWLGLGTPADAAVARDGLIHALDDEDPLVREIAAEALGQIGPPAAAAVPSLTGALEEKGAWLRPAAEEALKKIRPRP
jgi:HEAT repeats